MRNSGCSPGERTISSEYRIQTAEKVVGLRRTRCYAAKHLVSVAQYAAVTSSSAGVELLKPAPDDLLQRSPVSKRVSSSKAPADDPTLIDQVAA